MKIAAMAAEITGIPKVSSDIATRGTWLCDQFMRKWPSAPLITAMSAIRAQASPVGEPSGCPRRKGIGMTKIAETIEMPVRYSKLVSCVSAVLDATK